MLTIFHRYTRNKPEFRRIEIDGFIVVYHDSRWNISAINTFLTDKKSSQLIGLQMPLG